MLPKLKETARKYSTATTLEFVGSMIHIYGDDKSLDVSGSRNIIDVLSEPGADMDGRYPPSKLIERLCFHELAKIVSKRQGDAKSRMTLNIVNPAWCKSSLGRNKIKGAGVF